MAPNKVKIWKDIDPEDYALTPFKVYKDWAITSNTASDYYYENLEVQFSKGIVPSTIFNVDTAATNSDGTYQEAIHGLINQTYYNIDSKNLWKPPFDWTLDFANSVNSMSLDDKEFWMFGIPSRIFGEQIKPGTVTIEYSGPVDLTEVSGVMYSGSIAVGHVFRDHGNIVIWDAGVVAEFDNDGFDEISFRSQTTLYEREVFCEVGEGEFNVPLNRTFYSGSESILYTTGDVSGSYIQETMGFGPYITSIGLYNDDYELLAVAKLANPIKNPQDRDLAFLIRIDV